MGATRQCRQEPDDRHSNGYFERVEEERLVAELAALSLAYVRRLERLPQDLRVDEACIDTLCGDGPRPSLRDIDRCHEAVEARLRNGSVEVDPADVVELRAAKVRLDRLRERIVGGHVGFVAHVVQEMTLRPYPDPDLVQEGVLGLLEALERFDHTRGFRFMTYAYWWVRRAVGRYWGNRDRVVHLSENALRRASAARRARRDLWREIGREPEIEELAAQMDVSPSEAKHRLDVDRGSLSIDGDDQDSVGSLARTLADESTPDPFECLVSSRAHADVRELLDKLNDRHRDIVRLRFGLDGSPPLTLREAGARLGLSRERVRQLEVQAIDRLRRLMRYRGPGAC